MGMPKKLTWKKIKVEFTPEQIKFVRDSIEDNLHWCTYRAQGEGLRDAVLHELMHGRDVQG